MAELREMKEAAVSLHLDAEGVAVDLANYMAENGLEDATSGEPHYDALRMLTKAEKMAEAARTILASIDG